ncbi:TlpA family protein disulfide reductase [Nocardia sp. NBC_01329]|uniref:TlpA family protein disulfide reductase n=1 Tax=Nocardia sp. NBC_01329 TaxID=2903594 RepID=UPI002E13941B|nr:TlpA family protein disulfide reductase [Nocardia sp. NBC_01329]
MTRVPVFWKWALTAVIVALAAAVAFWPRGGSDDAGSAPEPARQIDPALRAASGAAGCPTGPARPDDPGPLTDLVLSCLADGSPAAPVGATGRPLVLNLWAYWCQPCRTELPLFQEYADRAGSAVRVVTVHSDPDETKALALLAALNDELRAQGRPELHLPALQDPDARVRAAAQAPTALPITVLVRPDGSIADYVARPFHDVDDIAASVADALGVAA